MFKRRSLFHVKIIILLVVTLFVLFSTYLKKPEAQNKRTSWWTVESIDTVKYSRDIAREKLNDLSFDRSIDLQVKNIAGTGATHIALGTPYDDEFLPYLTRWVKAARNYGLNVWFRGNFSGWEKWFGYSSIGREEHIKLTRDFILNHKDLFADGDIFTPCPECENGGPGDPRRTGDINGFRNLLISEYKITKDSFQKIGKKVQSNYNSMNGDVARLVMDKETTRALGGVVSIDHYVPKEKLASDIKDFADRSGGKIILGEYGAPIIDINGQMNQRQQADYLRDAFAEITQLPQVVGINYWVNEGGSTQLWEAGIAREAVGVITSYYSPKIVKGTIKNEIGQPIANSKISTMNNNTHSDSKGKFQMPILRDTKKIFISAPEYFDKELTADLKDANLSIVLIKRQEIILFKLSKFLYRLFK